MGFVKTFEQILANTRATADFYDAQMLIVYWETKREIIEKLLPLPLKPTTHPIALAFIADYPSTNFDVAYREGALFISAEFDGEEGSYCLSMPVTSDMAMAGGREFFGFPKKMADIHYRKDGESIEGWAERRGTRFMEIHAKLTGEFNDPAALDILAATSMAEDGSTKRISYNFKHFPAPEGGGFDYAPRLVKQETVFRPKEMQFGKAEIIFKPSNYDPWAEVEVVKMLGAVYTRGDNSMLGGKVVAEAGPMEFAPYAFLKWDMK